MTAPRHEVVGRIAEWLQSERELHIEVIQELGLPPTVSVSRNYVSDVSDDGLSAEVRLVDLSIMGALGPPTHVIKAAVTVRRNPTLLENLVDLLLDGCTLANCREDIERRLVEQGEDYVAAVASPEHDEAAILQQKAEDLADYFGRDSFDVVTFLPVGGISFPASPINVGPVRFRRLTADELAELMGPPMTMGPLTQKGMMYALDRMPTERWALEIRRTLAKGSDPFPDNSHRAVVVALQLLGFRLFGRGQLLVWTEPGPSRVNMSIPSVRLPPRGTYTNATLEQLQEASALAAQIPPRAHFEPESRAEVVLHRFMLGASEENALDSLFDYVVAMEAFLLPPSKEGEYRFKFALFGSRYLEDEPESRVALFSSFREIYDTRSTVAHGGAVPQDQVFRVSEAARDLCSRLIIKALHTSWPTVETLQRSVVSGMVQ